MILPSEGETTENLLKQITLHQRAVEKGLLVLIPSINFEQKIEMQHFTSWTKFSVK